MDLDPTVKKNRIRLLEKKKQDPTKMYRGEGPLYAPAWFGFCPLLKIISLGKPYLKNLDLSKLFVANASMK